jgi:hypothetical protein
LDDIVRRSTQKLCDDGELVDVILSGEQRLALEHFGEDASRTPDVHLYIVLLPSEHDLRCAVVAGRNVTRHLRVLYTSQSEIADLEITILVHQDVAGLQITVDDAGGVDVFQATLVRLAGFLVCQKIVTD